MRFTRVSGAIAAFTLAASLASVAPAVAQQADAELLFETCIGCHGIENYKNNYPTYRVPRLAGQDAQYIVAALKGYKDGARQHPTMIAQAASMSDADMLALGEYLQGMAEISADAKGTAPAAAATCTACHGTNGRSSGPTFPTLAGQHKDYLVASLTQYQKQERQNAIMAGFVAALSEDDINALASFYAAQTGLQTVSN